MELNDLRIVTTVISFIVFIGIIYWAMQGRRRASFDEAAQLPFVDDPVAQASTGEKQ